MLALIVLAVLVVPARSFAQAPINWVNWTGSETIGGVTKYVGQMVVPRTGGGSTTVTVKYTPPKQDCCGSTPGIAFIQTSNGTDYFAQGFFGSLGRNPARSPYTSSKVINIPDGGGAASDKTDIIALQFAGTNTLEFTDAGTGSPISIASPVFAYVSLNGNGYGFDQDFDILSFGDGTVRDIGFWGIGTSYKSTAVVDGVTQYQLLGTGEPHGTLQFRGSFSTVKWQSLSNEYWNGFTIGVANLAADIPIANAGLDQTVTANSVNGATVQLSGSATGSTNTPFTFTWSGDFGTASGQNPTVTLPVGTHTITLTVTDAANVSDTDTVVITVLPNPAPIITSPNTASGTYGAAFSYTITASNSPTSFGATGLPAGLTLTGAVISGAPAETGTFSIHLSAQNSGGTGTGSLTISVIKANASVVVSPYNVTYDGQSHSATVTSITGVNGETGNAVGSVTLNTTHTNAGTYSDTWSFTGSTNYNNIGATTTTDVIAKANATVVVTPYTAEYDGQPHSATVTSITGVNGETGAAVGSVTLNTTHTNVGIYSDSWSFTGGTNYNNIATTTITDTIKDTTPPVITSVAPSQGTLWPPNHQMVAITVNAVASDLVGVTSLKIISVTSSEPDNGLGDGDTAGDIVITGPLSVSLRAERSGNGNGRTYTITVEARDAAGNATTKAVTVNVPKSQGK